MKLFTTIILFCFVFALFNSCKRDVPLFEINNLNGNKISCFGNAGMGVGFKFPINSYESVEPCLRIGADGTELDVQLTKDSVLVAYHNSDLNESTMCNGTINNMLWSDIWGCHYANAFSSSIQIVSLTDLFSNLNNPTNYVYTFDCKLYTAAADYTAYQNQFANAIINFKNAHQLRYDQVLIESPDTTFLRILKNKDENLQSFIYPSSFEQALDVTKTMGLWGITIDNEKITANQVKLAHENGIRVTIWNLHKDKENTDAIYKSPDYIQSDDIIHLLKVFGKYHQ